MTRDEQVADLTAKLTKAENRIEDLLEVKDKLCISLEKALKKNLAFNKIKEEDLPDGFVALTTEKYIIDENEMTTEKVFVNVDYISRISPTSEFGMSTRIDSIGKLDILVKESFEEVMQKVKQAQTNIFK
tara:strand:- start:397 stop:786 length:390 start_codon:yes stop_codon:yes gene_type:complete